MDGFGIKYLQHTKRTAYCDIHSARKGQVTASPRG